MQAALLLPKKRHLLSLTTSSSILLLAAEICPTEPRPYTFCFKDPDSVFGGNNSMSPPLWFPPLITPAHVFYAKLPTRDTSTDF